MGSDEDPYSCESTFSKSPVGTLINRISKMLRNPMIDTELDETLDSFLDQLNESQRYLSHGIFNVKFAEAGLFLQNAVALYGKKVDSLWDSTLQYQMELCSCTKATEANEDEATIITQRLNRNKRKKQVLPDTVSHNSLYEDLNAVCDKANTFLKGRCSTLPHHGEVSENNVLHSSDSALSAPVTSDGSRSICGFRFPVVNSVNNLQTGEKLCNYGDLYLNCAVPFLETSKESAANVDGSECSMTTRKNDWLLQKYVTERHLTNQKFWSQNLADDFEVFRQSHQQITYNVETNIRLSLDERARSLCPQAFVVKLPRLPEELMSEYVNSNNVHVTELIQDLLTKEKHTQDSVPVNPDTQAIKKGSERISDADSLFQDGPFHDSDDTHSLPDPSDNLLSQRSSTDSGICLSEGLALSVVTEPGGNLISNEEVLNDCGNTDIVETLPNNDCSNTDNVDLLPNNDCGNNDNVESLPNNDCGSTGIVESLPVIDGQLGSDSFAVNTAEEIVENIGRNEDVVESSLDSIQERDQNIVTGVKTVANEKIPAVPMTVVHKSNLKPMKDENVERKNLKRKLLQEQNSEKLEKRKKPQTRFRWLKTTTTTLTSFEHFFKQHYQPEFGEGDIVEDESDDDNDALSSAEVVEDEEEMVVATELAVLPSIPSITEETPEETIFEAVAGPLGQEHDDAAAASTIELNDILLGCENSEEPPSNCDIAHPDSVETNTSSIQEDIASVVTTSEEHISEPVAQVRNSGFESIERLRAVTEWKKFIEPKLKAAEQSCKFDIHEYGSHIMDAIPADRNLNFKDLANGKSSSEVTRLFLASLQLANTYNIEIVGAQQGELANDKLEIKLLSRERYHEHLDEYEAPSENSFREKLARIQALQPSLPVHSTPSKSYSTGKHKRKRFC